MNIDIYKSTKHDDKYLSVPEGTDVANMDFPADIDPDLLSITPFKSGLEIDLSKPRMGLNQENILKQIEEKGYAIHGATMEASIGLTGKFI